MKLRRDWDDVRIFPSIFRLGNVWLWILEATWARVQVSLEIDDTDKNKQHPDYGTSPRGWIAAFPPLRVSFSFAAAEGFLFYQEEMEWRPWLWLENSISG